MTQDFQDGTRVDCWQFDFQNHQCDDDGNNGIRKGIQFFLFHLLYLSEAEISIKKSTIAFFLGNFITQFFSGVQKLTLHKKTMTHTAIQTAIKPAKYMLVLALAALCMTQKTQAQQNQGNSSKEFFTVENYYKVKWGFADEFIELWKKNHYPLLKKAIEKGDIISVTASKPRLHSGEDTRWDFRVTLVFRNAILAFDENLTTPYKKELFPDSDALVKAEQHRFELLIAHWDVEVGNIPLN